MGLPMDYDDYMGLPMGLPMIIIMICPCCFSPAFGVVLPFGAPSGLPCFFLQALFQLREVLVETAELTYRWTNKEGVGQVLGDPPKNK